MGNHFHLLVKMIPEDRFTDEEIRNRYESHFGDERDFTEGQIPYLREKLSSLSEFKGSIKFYVRSSSRNCFKNRDGVRISVFLCEFSLRR